MGTRKNRSLFMIRQLRELLGRPLRDDPEEHTDKQPTQGGRQAEQATRINGAGDKQHNTNVSGRKICFNSGSPFNHAHVKQRDHDGGRHFRPPTTREPEPSHIDELEYEEGREP